MTRSMGSNPQPLAWLRAALAAAALGAAAPGQGNAPSGAQAPRPGENPNKEAFDFLPGGTYEPSLSPPARVLGYALGSRFTEHHRLVEAVRNYAQNSERAALEKYGETEEK